MKLKHLLLGVLAAAAVAAPNALAVAINDPGVIGTIDTDNPPMPADGVSETRYLNSLLGFGANVVNGTIAGFDEIYSTGPTDYNGSVVVADYNKANSTDNGFNLNVPAGALYILAKYNGKNAGDVVWYVPDLPVGFTIPEFPAPLWTTDTNKYGISHISWWEGTEQLTPDGGATMALLGLALTGLGIGRRFIKKA